VTPGQPTSLRSQLGARLDQLARVRYWLLCVAAAGLAWVELSRPNCTSDVPIFNDFTRQLLDGHLGAVYSTPWNQAGPLELLWVSASTAGGSSCPEAQRTVAAGIIASLLLVAASLAFIRSVLPPALSTQTAARFELLVGVLAVDFITPLTLKWGHPADVAIPALWVLAHAAASRRRAGTAGLLIGLACGWETWAVLGVPLLLSGGWRTALKAAVPAAITGAAWYAPFVLSGHFAMSHMVWEIAPTGPLGEVTGMATEPFSWRVIQAVVVLSVGVAAVRLSQRRRLSGWFPALAIGATRVLTDPVLTSYYELIVAIPAVLGLLAVISAGAGLRRSVAGGLSVTGLFLILGPHPRTGAATLTIVLGAIGVLLAGLLLSHPSPEPCCTARYD
jgi:hypothetical protein